jgi:hypothetical protein
VKPPRKTLGKAGTQGTKPLPGGAGVAARPFPIHLFNARDGLRDLGAKIAAGFLNILCVRTVEKFALRVVGNPWRLLAFF